MMTSPFSQDKYEIRFDWGLEGLRNLQPAADVLVIVDVLSFSTCVSIAVNRCAEVFPFPWKDARAAEFALAKGAVLAGPRESASGPSLSPRSLLALAAGTRIVLPSPNGSQLSTEAGSKPTLTACLRNAAASAKAARDLGPVIGVIAAGERWQENQSLRPCLEDQLGAGAVISALGGQKSPEAQAAEQIFLESRKRLPEVLMDCASGRELSSRGFSEDLALASELNSSPSAAFLLEGRYQRSGGLG